MRDSIGDPSRRDFLRGAAVGAIAVPVLGLIGAGRLAAADKPKLDPRSSQAQALSYVHDASKASDNPAYQDGANCANCLQWKGGDSTWGACQLFPQHRVKRTGWCSAWAKQQ